MIRKTMRIGEVRTSIKLELEFWGYLREVADSRSIRLSRLVNEVAAATPERTNLASTLRTFCLLHAQLRWRGLQQEVEKLRLAGNTADLSRVLDACPLPCLLLTGARLIRRANHAFGAWLNIDVEAVLGQRLDNLMILRGPAMATLWDRAFANPGREEKFNATYVSPGRVRTAQALALALVGHGSSTDESPGEGACLVMFETLAARG